MKLELREEVERFFLAALECPPDEREALLDAACAGNDELRREVELLIAADEEAVNFIETPAIEFAASLLAGERDESLVGKSIGRYQIVSFIGKGGMSEVYLALDPSLGRKVALKLLPPEFTEDPERIRRLEREARLMSALNHPNIVTIYEIGRESGAHYIVEEFIDGQTLRQLMTDAQSQKIDSARTVDIAAQIADALAVAHEAGVTHRDIKPENVMLRPDGIVKTLDFGLAKLTEQPQAEVDAITSTLTKVTTDPGLVLGTPRYMSPEQARGQKVDARTDVFSLGVVMYEMVARRPPFEGLNALDVIGAILNQEPQPLAPPTPEAPTEMEELGRIIFKCLNKDRDARYPSARELTEDLRHLKELIASQSIAPARSLRKLALTRRRLMIAAMVLIALIAALSYAIFSRRAPGAQNQIKSLAVLPLKPISKENEPNYLGLGVADTIITKVSRINGLIVRPTSAVRRYADQEIDALQAARELQVDAALEGTMQREGDRLRVSVNLLRTNDGVSLWNDQFDLLFTEIFEMQDKVARYVVEHLHYQLSKAEQTGLAKQHTRNPAAYDYYAKAMSYFANRPIFRDQRERLDKAIEHFRKAIDLDPNYALAHAQLGYAYAHTVIWYGNNPALLKSAKRELEIAEKLDPQLAEIHVARSIMLWSQYEAYQFEEAIRELRRAQQIDPRAGHFELAQMYGNLGFPEWQTEIERALELDPTNDLVKGQIVNLYHINSLPEEMLAARKRLYNLGPDALYYLTKRMEKEAAPLVEELYQKNPDHTLVKMQRALLLALQGRFREAEALIFGMLDTYNPGRRHFARILARIYALEGRSEEAIKWLRVSAREGFPNYPAFQRDLYFDGIRNHPAFVQFMAELKARWENYRREFEQ